MELYGVETIALSDSSNALLEEIDRIARQVNEIRPLPPGTLKGLLHELLPERVYTSNAIEGNTLDLRETREVLKTGHVEIPKKREATEALNLGKAIDYAQENLVNPNTPLTPETCLDVHRILLTGIEDAWAGRFRDTRVTIHAAKYQPPDFEQVPGMVDQFFERLGAESDVHPVTLATWTHWTIARIHPFRDGNGRMARLWQDIVLFRNGLTCATVRPEDRQYYLTALESADEGRFDALVELTAQRLLATLDKYLSAQSKDEEVDRWASELAGEAGARAAESRKLAYSQWTRQMELLRYEFERCAARVTRASDDIEIQVRSFSVISQSKWEAIRSGERVAETWYFKLDFRRGKDFRRYFFFFGKHLWSDTDSETEFQKPHVTLLVSEQPGGREVAVRLGDQSLSTSLTLRELLTTENHIVRKRHDPVEGKETYDRKIDPTEVAKQFIQEVILAHFA